MPFPAVIELSSLDGTDGFRIDGASSTSGRSVSDAGDVNSDGFADVIIGDRWASYVVFGKDTGFTAALDLESLDGTDGIRLDGGGGRSVSGAGDVNGDGIDDVVVCDLFGGRNDEGTSHVVFGTATGFPAALDLATLDGANGFRLDGVASFDFSSDVSGAGDVNGDGFDDVIVGAAGADPGGRYSAGASYVVFGKEAGFAAALGLASLDGTNGFRLDGESAHDSSGLSVSRAGDVNGDGFDDLIVGAHSASPDGRDFAGSSYVVFGKSTGFTAALDLATIDGTNGFRLDGAAPWYSSGGSVSDAGDINGDGFDDLIVGAYPADPGGRYHAGSTYVVFGNSTGFTAALDLASLNGSNGFRLDGSAAYDSSGGSVSGAGDVNGDGFDDLIVGALGAGPGDRDTGSSYVVLGREAAFTPALDLADLDGTDGFRLDGADGDHSGDSVSGAGDVNGDGFDDLLIASFSSDFSYVVFGNARGIAVDDAASVERGGFVAIDVLANDLAGAKLVEIDALNNAMLLADGRIGFLDGPFGPDFSFTYRVEEGGQTDTATVEITVPDGLPSIFGGLDHEVLGGGALGRFVNGGGGADLISGRGGDDTLRGGNGQDFLKGGAGDDVLIGGHAKDVLNGGSGADLFVLDWEDGRDPVADRIGKLDPLEGDRLLISIYQLELPDGSLDGTRLRIEDAGAAKRISVDRNDDGAFETIAWINGGAGLDPDDFLANAITIA